MLGDPATVAAARAWRSAVLRLEHFARDLPEDPATWVELNTAADQAREQFYRASRHSLGVPGSGPA
jgi:hypothetical protein